MVLPEIKVADGLKQVADGRIAGLAERVRDGRLWLAGIMVGAWTVTSLLGRFRLISLRISSGKGHGGTIAEL